ncbi:MAG: hypothetical protein ABL962_08480 [Fimbriimonadaceae bacterium]
MSAPSAEQKYVVRKGLNPWLLLVGLVAALGCMAGAILIPIMKGQGDSIGSDNCRNNLRQLARASLLYASENDDLLPGKNWDDSLLKQEPDEVVYACPVQRRLDPKSSGYALSKDVAGKALSKIVSHESEILFFDSVVTEPGSLDDPSNLSQPPRHRKGSSNNIIFVDGHSAEVKK